MGPVPEEYSKEEAEPHGRDSQLNASLEFMTHEEMVMKFFSWIVVMVVAVVFASAAHAFGFSEPAWCDEYTDRNETFVWLYDGWDGWACYRLEIKCDGKSSGFAYVQKGFGYFDDALIWIGWGRKWGQCKSALFPAFDGFFFDDVKQHVSKCEFEDGSKVEVQVQPAEDEHCPPLPD
jgi:hypothetical protein